MFNPKTLEEARKIKYGAWADDPEGTKYYENYCAYEIFPIQVTSTKQPFHSFGRSYQCSRKNGHGINKLYCKQHAKGKHSYCPFCGKSPDTDSFYPDGFIACKNYTCPICDVPMKPERWNRRVK